MLLRGGQGILSGASVTETTNQLAPDQASPFLGGAGHMGAVADFSSLVS